MAEEKNEDGVSLGKSAKPEYIALRLANRHGLVAGATGTGKTVTLQVMAEGFSAAGVPVFVADVKGDLSGISQAGAEKPFLAERAEELGVEDYGPGAFPTVFWDLFGKQGHPIRTTVSEMGPVLLARLLNLNDTQEGVLAIAFQVADDEGLLLLDLKDLRALLTFLSENRAAISSTYGNVSPASVGAIQRKLLSLQQQGGKAFFGEPALKLEDFLRTDSDGRGMINVLAADKLMMSPKLYSTFLLWLLSELFEELPEVGDADRPKLVFFFDEAHLLFKDAPKALLEKVEQVVRLIRSKGVGVYFITQSPSDVPDSVLGQLGNRVQHALRAFTPRDRKAVKAAAETFRQNKSLDASTVITELSVGEALVSTLRNKGVPSVVQRTKINPPRSRMGPAKRAERKAVIAASPFAGEYEERIDRKSAYEMLNARAERAADADAKAAAKEAKEKERAKASRQTRSRRTSQPRKRTRRRQSATESFFKSTLSSVGRTLGRELVRGLLGSLRR